MKQPAAMTDEELLDTYEATSGRPGDEWADELIAEIKRRNLDV